MTYKYNRLRDKTQKRPAGGGALNAYVCRSGAGCYSAWAEGADYSRGAARRNAGLLAVAGPGKGDNSKVVACNFCFVGVSFHDNLKLASDIDVEG